MVKACPGFNLLVMNVIWCMAYTHTGSGSFGVMTAPAAGETVLASGIPATATGGNRRNNYVQVGNI
jgi:fructose-1,6-bisphosphatase/inositol monophosphatase family enzyme